METRVKSKSLQNVSNQTHPIPPPPLSFFSPPTTRTRTRTRTPTPTHTLSFSSSSEPASPVGVPFSWESLPGIPKHQVDHPTNRSRNRNRNRNHIPLPPGTSVTSSECNNINNKMKKIAPLSDPFLVALVECSRGGDKSSTQSPGRVGSGFGSGRRLGGLLDHLSCKSSADVAHTLVFLPSGPGSRRVLCQAVKKRTATGG